MALTTIGNYQIQAELARGGMGVVYRAYDSALNRPVAIKVLLSKQNSDPADLERFRVEAQATARMRHPNIVPIQTAGTHQGKPYLVMDLVEGSSLDDLIKQRGRLEELEAVKICEKLARALHYAHGLGVLHRDVKPANVLINSDGVPLLTDFGLAKLTSQDDRITLSGEITGTPVFMSPEQALGDRELIGPCSDVYALGATLYQMVTGQAPFLATTTMAVLEKVITEDPKAPTAVYPRLDPDLEEIVLRAMAKAPGDRYRSAEDMAEDLKDYRRDLRRGKKTQAPVEARAPAPGASRGLIAAAGACVLLTVGVLVGALLSAYSDRDAQAQHAEALEHELADLKSEVEGLRDAAAKADQKRTDELVAALLDSVAASRELGRVHENEEGLTRLTQLRPDSPRVLAERAAYALAEQKREKAVDLAGQALKRDPDNALALLVRGKTYLAYNGGDTRALADFERLIRLDRGNLEARLLRAQVLFYTDTEACRVELRALPAGAPVPLRVEALCLQARLLLTDPSQRENAIALAKQASALDPRAAKPHAFVGFASFLLGRPDQAFQVFNAALKHFPEAPWLYFLRGTCYSLSRPPSAQQALEDYRKAYDLGMIDWELNFALLTTSISVKDWESSCEAATRILAVKPEHFESFALRGQARLELRQYAGARDDLKRAIERVTRDDQRDALKSLLSRAEWGLKQ